MSMRKLKKTASRKMTREDINQKPKKSRHLDPEAIAEELSEDVYYLYSEFGLDSEEALETNPEQYNLEDYIDEMIEPDEQLPLHSRSERIRMRERDRKKESFLEKSDYVHGIYSDYWQSVYDENLSGEPESYNISKEVADRKSNELKKLIIGQVEEMIANE